MEDGVRLWTNTHREHGFTRRCGCVRAPACVLVLKTWLQTQFHCSPLRLITHLFLTKRMATNTSRIKTRTPALIPAIFTTRSVCFAGSGMTSGSSVAPAAQGQKRKKRIASWVKKEKTNLGFKFLLIWVITGELWIYCSFNFYSWFNYRKINIFTVSHICFDLRIIHLYRPCLERHQMDVQCMSFCPCVKIHNKIQSSALGLKP